MELLGSGLGVPLTLWWRGLVLRRSEVSKVQAIRLRVLSVGLSVCFGCHPWRHHVKVCFRFAVRHRVMDCR